MYNYKLFIFIIFYALQIYTSEHNHTEIHIKQWMRLAKLLEIYEIEQEKLNKNSFEIWRSNIGLPSRFDCYISTSLLRNASPGFRGIFKALDRLCGSMVCSSCRLSCLDIIQRNREWVRKNRM